jgi:hypothetical protein
MIPIVFEEHAQERTTARHATDTMMESSLSAAILKPAVPYWNEGDAGGGYLLKIDSIFVDGNITVFIVVSLCVVLMRYSCREGKNGRGAYVER